MISAFQNAWMLLPAIVPPGLARNRMIFCEQDQNAPRSVARKNRGTIQAYVFTRYF
jgi:hypothetical protein